MATKAAATTKAVQNIRPVHAETFTTCMEQLQEGYVASIAATAGCLLEKVSRDYYGLDARIVQPAGSKQEELVLGVQLKNTTTLVPDPKKPEFSYKFKARSHLEHLTKARSTMKALLLVMVSHPHQSDWTTGDHKSLSIQHCCYWANLEHHQIPPDVVSPTVKVLTQNIFSAPALIGMFERLQNGQSL